MTNTATQTAPEYATYDVGRFMIHRNVAILGGGVGFGVTGEDALAMFSTEDAAVTFAGAQMRRDGAAARTAVQAAALFGGPVGFEFGGQA